jgi:hypothetical protein
VIGSIDLRGGEHVREIVLSESGGDRTNIAFDSIVRGPSAMSTEEQRALGVTAERPVPPL